MRIVDSRERANLILFYGYEYRNFITLKEDGHEDVYLVIGR